MNEHEPMNSPEQGSDSSSSTSKKDRLLPISILVGALLVAGALIFTSLYHGGSPAGTGTTPATTPTTAQGGTVASTSVTTLGPRDAILGSANAPVTMIEYGDYQCPFCGQYFSQTEPAIVSSYVNTGKVKLVFRNLAFLGPESTAAAEAAECAEDQNKLWPYHDALYNAKVGDAEKGGAEDDGFFTRALFLQLASTVGLNVPTFTACIDSNKYAAMVANEKTAAAANGINSTPTFFVNGVEVDGAQPYSIFQEALNTALQ